MNFIALRKQLLFNETTEEKRFAITCKNYKKPKSLLIKDQLLQNIQNYR